MPNVSLTPAMEKAIGEAVDAGEYASVSEVVREGIRLWQQSRKDNDLGDWTIEELRAELAPALAELDRGEGITFDMEDVIARARKRWQEA